MKLKGIIFDVDGTIADTEEIHRQAFNQSFNEFNIDWHWSVEDYHQLLSISGGKERFKHCLKQDKDLAKNISDPLVFIQKLHQRKSEIYRHLLSEDHIKLRPGIKRLIHEARDKKIQLAIATSSSGANLKTLINNTLDTEPEELFSIIVTCDSVADKKPSPVAYQCALAGLGLSANVCVAFEDTRNGNLAALSAGLKTIITTHAYTRDDDFTGSSLVLNHLGDPDNPIEFSQELLSSHSFVDIGLINKIVMNVIDVNYIENDIPRFASNLN